MFKLIKRINYINNLKERINEKKRPLTDFEELTKKLTKEEKLMYARLYRNRMES